MPPSPRLTTFAWGVLAYNILVVIWGALVRATGSGAGCGEHWPLCNGSVVPAFPQWKTAIEFSHRASSGLAFLAVIALYFLIRRAFPPTDNARRAAFYSIIFMINETLVGAALVLFGLVAGSRSPWRAVVLVFHLANTMMLLAAITLSAHWSAHPAPRWQPSPRARKLFLTAIVLAIATAGAGGIAALGDTLFPASSVAAGMQEEFARDAHWMVRLRVFHPVVAVAAGLYFLYLVMTVPGRHARTVTIITLAQFALGALNIFLLTPLWTQLTHLLLTDLLWVALILYGASLSAQVKNPAKN